MVSGAQLEIAVKATAVAEIQSPLNSPLLLEVVAYGFCIVLPGEFPSSGKGVQITDQRFALRMPLSTSRSHCLFLPVQLWEMPVQSWCHGPEV